MATMAPNEELPRGPLEKNGSNVRRAGYIGAIVVNFIVLYVMHHLLVWGVPFVTPAFADVLWAIDLSIQATIVANLLYLFYDERWFRGLLQIGLTVIALLVAAILYARFPFDFGAASWNQLAQFGLLLVMFALVIATIVQVVVEVVEVIRGPFNQSTPA